MSSSATELYQAGLALSPFRAKGRRLTPKPVAHSRCCRRSTPDEVQRLLACRRRRFKGIVCGVTNLPIVYYALGMETIKGVPVTEEMIQKWADEAEKGYDVAQLRKRGRKPVGDGPARVVPVRLDDTLLSAVDERAEQDHITRSELIRAALRAYVA